MEPQPVAVLHATERREASAAPREATAVAVLTALAALAPFLLGFLSVAPNRLLSPRLVPLPVTTATTLCLGLFLVACLAVMLLARRAPLLNWAEAAAALALCSLVAVIGLAAREALQGASPVARAAPAAGLWVAMLLLALAAGCCAAGRSGTPRNFMALSVLGLAVLWAAGALADLSLAREAMARGGEIRLAFWQHLALAGGALFLALAVALPLSLLALRRSRVEALLMAVANGFQVIPSIALFGLLMGPLAALAAWAPALRGWGIGGIGPAPAVLGISTYLLLPLASAFLAGLRVASPAVIDAARGQGLTEGAILRQLRLPLGLGVMAGGVRVAAVQAIGLATLAALIGGGGLGALVFQGIGQLATDLILLGVLPVVALSLLADGGCAALQAALERRR
ncbi:ABC transporter permease [Teichococcus oryzae]|uniref:ABC transporter permease subunit n=1 Tax=Teichococcus oryzae TaxID=1608942 RepID=A0A5B2TEF9_9PROT|nr:ABC transporter permease subunit [Pseudoroseomonas oryzae]KAA2212268.1 ABC transporter permease subunit [Pseudoroseomonas oryzae]